VAPYSEAAPFATQSGAKAAERRRKAARMFTMFTLTKVRDTPQSSSLISVRVPQMTGAKCIDPAFVQPSKWNPTLPAFAQRNTP
jgi:hypothetical protein